MNENIYRREVYGEWIAETEEEKFLRQLAQEYIDRTEKYDNMVCTARGKDGKIPANLEESIAINRYAREVIKNITTRTGIEWKKILYYVRQINMGQY